jgi:hypothetical protein
MYFLRTAALSVGAGACRRVQPRATARAAQALSALAGPGGRRVRPGRLLLEHASGRILQRPDVSQRAHPRAVVRRDLAPGYAGRRRTTSGGFHEQALPAPTLINPTFRSTTWQRHRLAESRIQDLFARNKEEIVHIPLRWAPSITALTQIVSLMSFNRKDA